MPYNLFLIVIITGYFILTFSQLFKYNIQRLTRERILFESILVGLQIIVGGFLSRFLYNYFLNSYLHLTGILNILNEIPFEKPHYFWTFVFSSLISLIIFWFINLIIVRYYPKNDQIIRAVNKNGDEIEKLFKDSALNGNLIQVTLKNDKVYIGFCEEIPIPKKTNYLVICPYLSGYRDKENKQLIITTDYKKVVDKFIEDIKEKTEKEVESITLNTDIIIKQDEILTAGIYEQTIYDEFNKVKDKIQVEPDKPKRDRKPKVK